MLSLSRPFFQRYQSLSCGSREFGLFTFSACLDKWGARGFRNYATQSRNSTSQNDYIPLGWSNMMSAVQFNLSHQRRVGLFFAGSSKTSPRREIMLDNIQPLCRSHLPLFSCNITQSNGFRSSAMSPTVASFYTHCLIPCGKNTETYRLWESIVARCIPIVESCDQDLLLDVLRAQYGIRFKYIVRHGEWESVAHQALRDYIASPDQEIVSPYNISFILSHTSSKLGLN